MINLRTKKARRTFYRFFIRNMLLIGRKSIPIFENLLKRQYKLFADLYSTGVQDYVVIDKYNSYVRTEIENLCLKSVTWIVELYKKERTNLKKDLEGVYWPVLRRWLSLFAVEQAVKINKTTKKLLREKILYGIENGLSNNEIVDLIIADSLLTSKIRARRIVRTETHTAMEKASQEVIKSWKEPDTEKAWQAAMDLRTRDIHKAVDGQRTKLNLPFIVDGEHLMFPGDSSLGASARNIINCRCITLYYF